MKTVTSATVFQDAVGMRLSVTYSEVDDETGKIVADNKRASRVITDSTARTLAQQMLGIAQDFVDTLE